MKNKNAANKSAAGTGGARVARYRRAVMEPKAEPRKRHTREISGSIGKDCIQKQAPQKKSRTNKLTFVHFWQIFGYLEVIIFAICQFRVYTI